MCVENISSVTIINIYINMAITGIRLTKSTPTPPFYIKNKDLVNTLCEY